jgi:hypothetical protein
VTQTAAGATDDTMQMRVINPPAARWTKLKRAARRAAVYFMDRVFAPLLGCVIGLSIAMAIWLLILMWWFNA